MQYRNRPAGQAADATTTTTPAPAPAPIATTPPVAPAPAPAEPPIAVAPDGRIAGIDGMLSQISSALMQQAGPVIARDILPIIQADHDLQVRVGKAAGDAIAAKLRPWVILMAGSVTAYAAVMIWATLKEHS